MDKKLTAYTTYADAQKHWAPEKLWELVDGNRDHLNLAHECIDRHAEDPGRIAITVVHAAGEDEMLTYRDLAVASSQFANYLLSRGVRKGDRIAVMLEPSRAFYVTLFGIIKTGAIAVPLFTLFGPEALALRMNDCEPSLLVTNPEKAPMVAPDAAFELLVLDDPDLSWLAGYSPAFECTTSSRDLAIFQYTSGTTRELPDAIRHTHGAIVTLLLAALYGTGLRPGDKFFCPSSPAWGHGLWHGTLAPLVFGIHVGAYSGRFNADRLLAALSQHQFTNMSAAATHYRMMRNSPDIERHRYAFDKLSFTGEPIDSTTETYISRVFGAPVCSMYGTTEIGVILVSYPGAEDFVVRQGSLGKPVPGTQVEVQDEDGKPCPPGVVGEMKVLRRGQWIGTKDLGKIDEDGYFHHAGRIDDIIISSGWTMSAVEIEDTLLKHPQVQEAAVIGVPDELRGQVVKAFVVSREPGNTELTREIQEFVRSRLSQHEYPRQLAYVAELPKTPAGKINRKVLRTLGECA
ncbi:MAG: acyl-CoA synthetase [Castellaniella sp.]